MVIGIGSGLRNVSDRSRFLFGISICKNDGDENVGISQEMHLTICKTTRKKSWDIPRLQFEKSWDIPKIGEPKKMGYPKF